MFKVLILLFFTSCASFITEPHKLKKWEYTNNSQCPKTFKVYKEFTSKILHYDTLRFQCSGNFVNSESVNCLATENPDLRAPSIANDITVETKNKIDEDNFSCLEYTTKENADYLIKVEEIISEESDPDWALLSGASLLILPAKADFKGKTKTTLINLKSKKSHEFEQTYQIDLWAQLFLFPLQPFFSSSRVQTKLNNHFRSLEYEYLTKFSQQ